MFEKRKRRRPSRRDYEGMPDSFQSPSPMPGMSPGPAQGRQNGTGIDQYMYRSIMSMLDDEPERSPAQDPTLRRNNDNIEQSGPDSVTLRIEIPTSRAEQLRSRARDLDESPQTLARLWVMERLREIDTHTPHQPKSGPNGAKTGGSPTALHTIEAPAKPTEPRDVVANAKERLGNAFIADTEEQAIFSETYAFRQWGPYIAALVLSQRGRKLFTLEDVCHILRDELMPEAYNSPSILESDLTLRDVELGRPGAQLRPFACIERVDPGVYSFIGFRKARSLRSGR
ncbi:hypothetical protein KAJ02_09945 [Candidatus Bipolaricaulota bacterium]|nr:hypothetical protein [Candidatus Bipolaricaulota bacterium]